MKAVLAEAVDWYVRLHDSAANQATRADWQRWLAADPRHAQAWTRIEQLQQRLGTVPPEIASGALEQARQQRRTALKMFAVLLGAGAIGWQGYRASPWSADYATRIGERRQMTLADGTRLELNTNTRVDIRFDAEQRLVYLRQGEILIQTAKDTRPFSVQTAEGRILALGTRFSVRQDSGLTRVAVSEHAVQVTPLQAPGRTLRVDAGRRLTFAATQLGNLQPLATDAEAWTRGMLVSVDWRLADVVDELARYRPGYLGCAVEVGDLRLSGAFNLDDSEVALASLQDALPIHVRRLTRYWVRIEARDA